MDLIFPFGPGQVRWELGYALYGIVEEKQNENCYTKFTVVVAFFEDL